MYIDKNNRKWFKGNLHTHTNLSDGRLSPEESIALYRENGYDFIIKESDRFYLPRIPEGREVSRLYMDISEETKAMLNLNWDEELPAKITISNYTYRFAYTEAMNSVTVTNIIPL